MKTIDTIRLGCLVFALTAIATSCKKDKGGDPEPEPELQYETNIYVAGYEGGIARIWKNGVPADLTDGSPSAAALSVCVNDGDVYAAGVELTGGKGTAKIWKNGVGEALTDGTKNAEASSVYVSGTDVYVAGYEGFFAKIWKNGVPADLTNGPGIGRALSVFTSGKDVYVAGYEAKGLRYVARVWKNGEPMDIADGTQSSYARSVVVDGGAVYVGGDEENRSPSIGSLSKAWKNGEVLFTNRTNHSTAYSVYVSGEDVYIAGQQGNSAMVWKNGEVLYTLTEGEGSGVARSVYVFEGDVYAAGSIAYADKTSIAKLWKNGLAQDLSVRSGSAGATSVVVVKEEVK